MIQCIVIVRWTGAVVRRPMLGVRGCVMFVTIRIVNMLTMWAVTRTVLTKLYKRVFFWFSRMISCVGHLSSVIVGWVSASWISVGFVGAFLVALLLEGDSVALSESPPVIW